MMKHQNRKALLLGVIAVLCTMSACSTATKHGTDADKAQTDAEILRAHHEYLMNHFDLGRGRQE